MVADLGTKNLMLLRNHGTMAVGETVGEAFIRLYTLERACQAQVMALTAGDDQQPAAGLARGHGAAGRDRAAARGQAARVAGAEAEGVPPRPELRDAELARRAANVSDYRALAKARLPHFLFEYLDGGSYDEVTLRRNVADLRSVALKQRVLRDVSEIDLVDELLGKRWALPVGLGPVGLSGLYARRGEVQAARAAEQAGIPFTLSTLSGCSIEEVAAAAPLWFQLYIVKDRAFVERPHRARRGRRAAARWS